MIRDLIRGAAAGAAGTTALNAATYLDMAGRARPASSVQEQVIDALADRVGVDVPGSGDEKDSRLEALGALGGIATGITVGAVYGWLRAHGLRFNKLIGPVVIGATAMVATDYTMAALGVSDPRDWSGTDWVSDVVPHLVFGAATYSALVAMDPA